MIDAIVVCNVGPFTGLHELRLDKRLTVLVGTNNTGKSTLLKAALAVGGAGAGSTHPQRCALDHRARLKHMLPLTQVLGKWPQMRSWLDANGLLDDRRDSLQFEQSLHHQGVVSGGLFVRLTHEGISFDAASVGYERARTSNGHDEQVQEFGNWGRRAIAGTVALWEPRDSAPQYDSRLKRFTGTDETHLRDALVHLRLNHPRRFDRLHNALVATFPEFKTILFEEEGGNPGVYLPRLVLKHDERVQPLARSEFGSGVWSFLCVLTAAHVAHASGTATFLLDEPTLFMHPTLERALLRNLLDDGEWDGAPMRLVVATHSPVIVDAAYSYGKLWVARWRDSEHTSAELVEFTSSDAAKFVDDGAIRPSEVVHSQGLLFVEGRSDQAALLQLSALCQNPRRLVALEQPDLFRAHKVGRLALLGRLAGKGFVERVVVLWDLDKKEAIEKELGLTQGHQAPRIHYAGTELGKDLESCFCEQDFLTRFLADYSNKSEAEVSVKVAAELANLGAGKGDDVVAALFNSLLGGSDSKVAPLESLASYFVGHADESWAVSVRANLVEVFAALDARLIAHTAENADV